MSDVRLMFAVGLLAPFALAQQPPDLPDPPGMRRIAERKAVISSSESNPIQPSAVAAAATGATASIQPGMIGTIAGNGNYGFSDGGGQAVTAQIDAAFALTADNAGNVYIADTFNHRVRKVAADGTIITIAGTGQEGSAIENTLGIECSLSFPRGVAIDPKGNVYIADSGNFRVRRLSPDGIITTFAGSASDGFSGDGGSATSAQMRMPRGLAADSDGNVYIADSWNYRIRKVDVKGVISTIAGTGENGYSGDGAKATAAALGFIQAISVDNARNVYVSDALNHVVRRISPDGIIQTVAGNGDSGWAGDGGSATGAQLSFPRGLALDPQGILYVADSANHRIRQVVPSGTIKTVAGTGEAGFAGDAQSAASAKLNYPYGLAASPNGNFYVADLRNYRIRQMKLSAPLALTISSAATLPQGGVGVLYSYTLAALGGSPPYNWTLTSGTLPSGLSLSISGALTGTPTRVGNSTFTVRVTDGSAGTVSLQFSLAVISVLTITTDPVLASGFVGGGYTQTLAAAGGSPPYAWSASGGALPPGLTLSASGTISGTPTVAGSYGFTVKVADGISAAATKACTLTILAGSALTRAGVLAHLVSGGGWKTTISLVNLSPAPVPLRIVFHGDDGTPATLPLTVTQQQASQVVTASSLDRVLNPNATLMIDTEAPQNGATLQGWADVLASGPINGFAIFRQAAQNGPASEGTVPLQNQFPSTMILPYDNTGGFTMGAALANLAAPPATITATIWDDSGTQVGAQTFTVAGNGHTAFVLPDRLPLTIGKRGLVMFQSFGGNGITGLGLRFSPFGTFTSVPTIPGQ